MGVRGGAEKVEEEEEEEEEEMEEEKEEVKEGTDQAMRSDLIRVRLTHSG